MHINTQTRTLAHAPFFTVAQTVPNPLQQPAHRLPYKSSQGHFYVGRVPGNRRRGAWAVPRDSSGRGRTRGVGRALVGFRYGRRPVKLVHPLPANLPPSPPPRSSADRQVTPPFYLLCILLGHPCVALLEWHSGTPIPCASTLLA